MTAILEKMELDALKLSREERAFLADRLLSSLGGEALSDVDAAWVAEVFTGAYTGRWKDYDLKRALVTAGEMSRWDDQQPKTDLQRKLEDAKNIISDLARATLPSRSHTQIADLLLQFEETRHSFRAEISE